jgi:hypothetical protein
VSNFYLRKWYLDAADDKGNLYIGYWASLQWYSLCLHFYQHLYRTSTYPVQVHSELSKHPEPVYEANHQLLWHDNRVDAQWITLEDAVCKTLLQTDTGAIQWHCTQPKAQASIYLPHTSFKGYGYTECLDITIPVWHLPFNTLYWGRSHSENHSVVWIKWDGITQQSLVLHNGVCSPELVITDKYICGSDFELQLGEDVTLRQGQLGATMFQAFKAIKAYFPDEALEMNEHKCYNIGQLVTKNSCEKAITIYEKVHW